MNNPIDHVADSAGTDKKRTEAQWMIISVLRKQNIDIDGHCEDDKRNHDKKPLAIGKNSKCSAAVFQIKKFKHMRNQGDPGSSLQRGCGQIFGQLISCLKEEKVKNRQTT